MNKELKIALIKYSIIVAVTLIYIAFMMFFVGPTINQVVFGQSAFDNTNPYGNQYGQQQYGQQQYNDPYNQQYQQQPYNSYQQYGTPTYGGYQQYGQPMGNYNSQFGIAEIISMVMGGGGIAYGRYTQQKTKENKEVIRDMMAVQLKDMENQRELARVAYTQMPNKGNDISDAPAVQLNELDKGIDTFRDKTAKT